MPAGRTYTPIARTILSSAAASVTFSSISGSYTDLVLVADCSDSNNNTFGTIRLNGDTGANYSRTIIFGDSSGAGSARGTNINEWFFSYQTSSGFNITQIMNYSNTTTNKTGLSRGTRPSSAVDAGVYLWRNTAAITSVVFAPASGNFTPGSTFTLYGIAAA